MINFDEMAAAQRNSPEMKEIQTSASLQLCEVLFPGSTATLICDMSTESLHPVVSVLASSV